MLMLNYVNNSIRGGEDELFLLFNLKYIIIILFKPGKVGAVGLCFEVRVSRLLGVQAAIEKNKVK